MSKLYVGCIVVALLALALVPAIAVQIDSGSVEVTATVPQYVNVTKVDTAIEFGTLADATNVGYVQSCGTSAAGPGTDPAAPVAFGTSQYVVKTNVSLWSVVDSGSDLTSGNSSDADYEIELQFSTAASGIMDLAAADSGTGLYGWFTAPNYWAGWTGCGATQANADDVSPAAAAGLGGLTLADNGKGTILIRGGQEFTIWTRAQLYQNGYYDPAGTYGQDTDLTTTLYDANPY